MTTYVAPRSREAVYALAEQVRATLAPACLDIAIAGSVRRLKDEPHDVELVCLPRLEQGLFDLAALTFDAALQSLIDSGLARPDDIVKRWGAKLKRLIVPSLDNMALELYFADKQNFGNTLAIRTGNQEFSMWLMVPRRQGGIMPDAHRQMGGYLWHIDASATRQIVPCRHEADFFRALGVETPPEPPYRDLAAAKALARKVRGR